MTKKASKRSTRSHSEPRWGLKDMYVNRPEGIAGQIMLAVWGSSEREFEQMVIHEWHAEQCRNPHKFVKKIGERLVEKGRRRR